MNLPPTFDNVEDERLHRKQKLAGALRIFGRVGFGEGVAGHITVRDPEFTDHFWVNPFGMSFRHIKVSDLILVNHAGDVVYGTQPVNRAAFVIHAAIHAARPDVMAAAHSHSMHGKAFSSLGIPLDPITQDSCIFYGDHTVIAAQGGAVVLEIEAGKELAEHFGSRQGGDPPEPWPDHRRPDGRRSSVLVPDDGSLVPGAAAGDGRRHAEADPSRDGPVHGRPDRAIRWPAGSASSRCGRRSAAPIPTCSTDRPGLSGAAPTALDRFSPEALFVVSGIAQYSGAVIAVSMFDEVAPASVAWVRVLGAALGAAGRVVPASAALDSGRTRGRGSLRHRVGADEPVLLPGDRSHRPRQERRDRVHRTDRGRRCVHPHRAQHRGARAGGDRCRGPVGRRDRRRAARASFHPVASSACGPPYIVVGRKVAALDRGVAGLGVGLAHRSDRDRADRHPRQRPGVDVGVICSSVDCWSACSRTRSATASTSTCCDASRCAGSRCCSRCCR